MQKENTNINEEAVSPNYGKTILAYLIDFAFTLIAMVATYFGISKTVIGSKYDVDGLQQQYNAFASASNVVDNGNLYNFAAYDKDNNVYGYSKYEDVVWKYYTVFLPSNPNATFLESDGFNGDKSNPSEVGRWVYTKIYGLEEDKEGSYYKTIDEATDFTVKPALKQSYIDALASEKNEDKTDTATKLNEYYFKRDGQNYVGIYTDAVRNFSAQPYVAEVQGKYSTASYMMWLPVALVGPAIFFFIIPLCIPKGRTLGKLFLSLGVASKEGVEAAKWQILIRYLFHLIIWYLLALPFNLTFTITISLTLLVGDFIVLMLSKSHRSIHDFISRTMEVDLKKSTIYPASSLDEEEVVVKKEEKAVSEGESYFNKPAKKVENEEPSFEVLDSTTIGKARKEAKEIKSFDEFESK